ncbi:MAG: gliding motility-associated C-terminal domain-containing protein [Bacteroidales bacterium]|nr:gliding motility-associated C-terminal domain-containing protein [Bacteroidales bacterium]
MKTLYSIVLVAVLMFVSNLSNAQVYNLNETNNGTTVTTCVGISQDDKGTANYSANQDRSMTFCPGNPVQRIKLTFESFNIDPTDTFYVYNSPTVGGDPLYSTSEVPYFQNQDLAGVEIYATASNPSGCLTIRLVADGSQQSSGWKASITCENMCQDVVNALDTFYRRYNEAGVMTERELKIERDITMKMVANNLPCDTIIDGDHYRYDTVDFYALDICEGDSLEVIAKPEFPYNDIGYHQSVENCVYTWSWGDNQYDTIQYSPNAGHKYDMITGYDLNLYVKDTSYGGCTSKNAIVARVRIAQNPIKTVAKLPDMCSGERQQIFVGYSANSTVIVDTIQFNQTARQSFDTRLFIPDGGGNGGSECYESPVQFTTFAPNAQINNGNDILDVCISIEHSFIGDLGFFLECPDGQTVTLKYNTHQNGYFLGEPLDGGSYDNTSHPSDSTYNPIGNCWTYCFSNQYTTNGQGVIGEPNNHFVSAPYNNGTSTNSNTIDSTHVGDGTYYFQTPIQGLTSSSSCVPCKQVDTTGFDVLAGCKMNGEWKLRICDNWGADNGWICSWWMDLSSGASANWTYQVPLDTVIWNGPFLTDFTSTTAIIAPPIDSCGNFEYGINIIDAFGCPWDTVTSLPVVCTPVVDLGPDLTACEGFGVELDAGNEGALRYNWEPTGETTRTIMAQPATNEVGVTTYIAQVTNYNGVLYCYGTDTIDLNIFQGAQAAFTTDDFPLEGCEPFEFQLRSVSSNAQNYEWIVGDETSTEADPSFTFPYGSYSIDLKVTSENGCVDSVHYDSIITVFKNPVADFGWSPSIPYASNPTVTFINQTKPESSTNRYLWQFQTNKHNPDDIVNNTDAAPVYTWEPQVNESVAGEYSVLLDAYTYNEGPSGKMYECHDTISKVITIINDNILFPTVITPNGDGINDVFAIHNLIDGQAFPDNELAIYNRYGKRIYFVQDLRTEDDFWDPDKTNSPTGTYFYRFIGRGPIRDVEFKGSVEVLR